MSQTHAVPQKQSPSIRFARTFIENNYLYLVSTFLVVLGCYRLVRSALLTGDEYTRTVYSLCILQAYEVLVIATAALIVRRFKSLNDAFSLLLIELVLLLDPTFFSNSFITLFKSHGAATNIVTLGLVPLKLGLLQRLVGVRPGLRYNAAFLFAAVSVYVAAWPLAYWDPWLTRYGYYYFLGVQVLLIAALLPRHRDLFPSRRMADGFVTPRQAAWLPAFLIAIPLVTAAAHYIESARIHDILFYPANVAPLLLAAAVLVLANTPHEARLAWRMHLVDAAAALAIVVSLPALNTPTADDLRVTRGHEPGLYMTSGPLIIGVVSVALVYLYALALGWRKEVVRRAQIGAAVAAIYLVDRSGVVSVVRRGTVAGLQGLVQFATAHPLVAVTAGWALSLLAAWRFRWAFTWTVCGAMTIALAWTAAPTDTFTFAELAEAAFLLALVVSHRFSTRDTPATRYVVAVIVAAIAAFRLDDAPSVVTVAVALALPVLGWFAGSRLRHHGYQVIAVAHGAACLVILFGHVRPHIHPAVAAIASGLVVFALGVLVTFRKERILARLQPRPGPHATGGSGSGKDGGSQPLPQG